MTVSVVPQEIRTAAGKMDACVSTVRSHVPTEVGGIADALPGSQSAGAASTLHTTWGSRFRGWANDAEAHASGLRTSADNWTDTDLSVRARQERLAREGVL